MPVVALAGSDGSFSGTVVDPSGSSVSGATVVARNERTGEERVVVANADGRYVLTGLRPSVYTIKVTFQGFAPVEYTGVQLAAAQEFPLDLTLQAAGVTEAVTVKGNATAMDLSSARIGVNVTEREVQNLPVNGRQMSQLMLQAPGSQNAGTGTWNDVRFSGRANQQNVIKFDGVEGSAIIDAAPGNIAGQISSPFKLQASLENVQEFRVESNNYPAEFGTGTGGQVSVITKSGSNRVSGSLFEYYRNDKFDAPNYFDSTRNTDGSVIQELPKSELSQHQFGGSIGAPIMKNRAFLFASYEGYRLDAGVNFVEAAPSAAAWARAVPAIAPLRPGFTSPDAVLLPGASANAGLRHLPAAEPRERRGELGQRALRLPDERPVVVVRPRVPRSRHAAASGRRQRPRRAGDERPDQRHLQRPGHAELRPADRVQGRLQRAEGRHPRRRPGRQRHRLRRSWRST